MPIQAQLPIYRGREFYQPIVTTKRSQSRFGADDSLYQPLEKISCFNVIVINNTGVAIDVKRANSDIPINIGNGITYGFDITDASDLSWRRADYDGSKDFVTMQYEVSQ